MRHSLPALLLLLLAARGVNAADPPRLEDAENALRKAVSFYHDTVARHGGYVWRYSGDLTLSEGEGKTGKDQIWVQPPGTPTVGSAFLDAYEATRDPRDLNAARDAAKALLLGQLHSGGWAYSITFDPAEREQWSYRIDLEGRPTRDPVKAADRKTPGGWDVWRKRKYKGNLSTLDDNTTQASTRFLVRMDQALRFEDRAIHEAALFALDALRKAQYPNGGWSASFDRISTVPISEEAYPIEPAAFPKEWSRTWPKDFTGCYVTNDNLIADMIAVLLDAHAAYHDGRDLAAAERAGRFLVLAQMPEPQPAWAQQYDRDMQPAWSRKFEPPAISGHESQGIMSALISLARYTGNAAYLEPIPKAIAYLRKSRLPDGRLARFYELETNTPLYFTRDYQITYDGSKVPRHYGFVVPSGLDQIERKLNEARAALADKTTKRQRRPVVTPALAARCSEIIAALDARGAWVEKGTLDAHDLEPPSGVIASSAFAVNLRLLSEFIQAKRGAPVP